MKPTCLGPFVHKFHKLHEAADVEEFKRIFIDCLECHYHTYTMGHILPRDVGENNLMFADPKEVAPSETTDDRSSRWGALHDFDLGSEIDEDGNVQPSNATYRTGTLPYMAVDLVRAPLKPSPRIEYVPPAHYYRHDLESFFYILIFASTRYTFEKGRCLPVPACLRTWQDCATASDSKNAFFGYRGSEAVKVAVLDHFLPLWDEWIFPLYIMFKTAFSTIPEPGFPTFKTYDMVTLNEQITFEAFMATIKVTPRNSAGERTR
ncbi:unnamed protein product [Cyclocybe aegerita]|uniref:Fungal-type protein kinase domain-containing protein n=1 Tax=Cyclocybe aegerita TaxID=1973307 RepID=A0A8S0W3R0_CYCAE|nr:unnamed protein product [Cyclocybe aegerita]